MTGLSKENFEKNSLEDFLEVEHVSFKSKFVQGNDSPFMIRELSKAIMTRPKLRNELFKKKLNKTERIIISNEITVLHS